ncbi:hypothetical protein BN1723_007874 [Verticillium longisporum]|uniref:Uncharacterized protein n=1 Tax=Verticillium longisporum TaxID=100787 RepID=A0A0G4NNT0_VERLO|nr:hypothetical protein BN1723_007874 [Verticillium longisporum]
MDLLMSLPIISYFLAPSVASWSTSLNLLFFYMTWTTLVLSHSALKIELVGTLGLRLVFWLLPSLVFLLFDTLIPTLAESLKYGGTSALPPTDPVFLARTLGLSLVNLALAVGLEAGISIAWTTAFQTPIFTTSTTLPVIPKSVSKERIAANYELDGWELTDDEIKQLSSIPDRFKVCGDAWLPIKSVSKERIAANYELDGWELTDDEIKQLSSIPDRFKVCGDAWLPIKVFFGDDE